jgi:hypothetical protein
VLLRLGIARRQRPATVVIVEVTDRAGGGASSSAYASRATHSYSEPAPAGGAGHVAEPGWSRDNPPVCPPEDDADVGAVLESGSTDAVGCERSLRRIGVVAV